VAFASFERKVLDIDGILGATAPHTQENKSENDDIENHAFGKLGGLISLISNGPGR
jgi:hypothetical protein